jgi:hypothetical protein
MLPRIGLVWLLFSGIALGATSPQELQLLDGTRIRCIGLSFNKDGAVALRSGESAPLTFTWSEISPSALPPEQKRQQEEFVRRWLNEATSSATASPAEAKQIIAKLSPLVTAMDSDAQERLGWIDAQVFVSNPASSRRTTKPKIIPSAPPSGSALPQRPSWLPEISMPDFSAIKTEFPERARRFVATLRESESRWWTFVGVVAVGLGGLIAFSLFRGGSRDQAEAAQRLITRGVIAGIAAALALLALTLLTVFHVSPVPLPVGMWNLLDVLILLILSWRLALRSPLAAGLLLVYVSILLLRQIWNDPETLAAAPVLLGLALLCFVCQVGALRGAVAYQRT